MIDNIDPLLPEPNGSAGLGDDEIRQLKQDIVDSFPNVAGAVTATHTELNYVDGVTSSIQQQLDNANNTPVRIMGTVSPAIGGVQNSNILLEDSSGADIGSLGFTNDDQLEVRSFNHGAGIVLQAEDNAGVLQNLYFGQPDSSSFIYHDGQISINTQVNGLRIRGEHTVADITNDTRLILSSSDNITEGEIGFINTSADILTVQNRKNGGEVHVRGTDSTGATRTLLVGDPNADVKLYRSGVEVARTNSAAAGGFQVNNTATGSGFERALTQSDIEDIPKAAYNYNAGSPTITAGPNLIDKLELTTANLNQESELSDIALNGETTVLFGGSIRFKLSARAVGFSSGNLRLRRNGITVASLTGITNSLRVGTAADLNVNQGDVLSLTIDSEVESTYGFCELGVSDEDAYQFGMATATQIT